MYELVWIGLSSSKAGEPLLSIQISDDGGETTKTLHSELDKVICQDLIIAMTLAEHMLSEKVEN